MAGRQSGATMMGLKLPWDRIKAVQVAEDKVMQWKLDAEALEQKQANYKAQVQALTAMQSATNHLSGLGNNALRVGPAGKAMGSALQNPGQAQQQYYQSINSQMHRRRIPSAPDGRMLIGLVGHSGVGKSTVAHHLRANWEFQVSAFAEPIKTMLSSLATVPDIRDKDAEIIPGVTLREAMEATGNALRGLDKDFLVHHWKQTHCHMPSVTPGTVAPFMVIDDVRFSAEAAMIRKMGGKLIRVINPSVDFGKIAAKEELNPCEIEIGDIEYDAAVYNKGSREDLVAAVDKVLEGWGMNVEDAVPTPGAYAPDTSGVLSQQPYQYQALPTTGSGHTFTGMVTVGGVPLPTITGLGQSNWRQRPDGQWEQY
jgi:hypothetical protein